MTTTQENEHAVLLATAHRSFESGLNAYAFFKVHDRNVGEDLVQDTFMKTWKYLVRGGKIEIMKAFLYHVLNHLIVDQYRRHKTSSLDALLDEGFEPGTDLTDRLINVLDGKRALLLIKDLPLPYQKVMTMRYQDGLSLEEMSVITGKSRNAMAVQVHRGLVKLKSAYGFSKSSLLQEAN